jgi:hypothetical protein
MDREKSKVGLLQVSEKGDGGEASIPLRNGKRLDYYAMAKHLG